MPDPDRIIVNPPHVHEVGAQIKKDAQDLMTSGQYSVQSLQSALMQVNNNNFPVQLYSSMYQLIDIHTKAFNQLYTERQYIGDALEDAKNAMEDADIKTTAGFNPTNAFDGPGQLTIVK